MNKTIFLAIFLLFAISASAQLPEAINYQAVARNTNGQAIANQNINVRLSIIRGPVTLYSETRNLTTNALGLFNVQIGSSGASSTTGDFASIYWLNNTPAITLKVELDVTNSGVFTEMGNQTLASVPFAYAAEKSIDAVNLGGRYVDNSITPNNGDVMQWNAAENAWKPASVGAPLVNNIGGLIGPIVPSAQWAFIGPQLTVTITDPTTFIANGAVTLGHTSTGQVASDVSIMPAYQLQNGQGGAGTITIFNPGNFPAGPITTSRVIVPTSCSTVINTPGTYKVGFAVRNNTSITLNNNDWLTGYVMWY